MAETLIFWLPTNRSPYRYPPEDHIYIYNMEPKNGGLEDYVLFHFGVILRFQFQLLVFRGVGAVPPAMQKLYSPIFHCHEG